MDCPFYLVVCSFRIPEDAGRSYTDYLEIYDQEVNPDSKKEVIKAFCEHRPDCDPDYIDTILVIRNSLEGGPKVAEHWA